MRVLLEGLSATASSGRCATSLGGSDEAAPCCVVSSPSRPHSGPRLAHPKRVSASGDVVCMPRPFGLARVEDRALGVSALGGTIA